ncbi:troponin C, isotype gamma-like [Homarus americanus]|uniref:troponin C, isotype gamma-like n=1 Tax=Homarus americanus TaxID=6706 RepID=UPI001C439ABE|nr:troponin C, isotype gamma-like [Homarus americanus]
MESIAEDKMKVLKRTFTMFDQDRSGFVPTNKIVAILNTLDIKFTHEDVTKRIKVIDANKEGKVNFDNFVNILSKYMVDDEYDDEAMYGELKEAFRLYDRGGNGYITTSTLKEILTELDNKLSDEDLDGIIEEIDEDGSGTVDFDEFMEMMTG